MTFIEMQRVVFFFNEIQVSFGGYCFTVSHLPEILNSTDHQRASDMLKSGTGVLLSQHSKRPPLFPYFPCLSSLIQVGFSLQNVKEAGAMKGKRDKKHPGSTSSFTQFDFSQRIMQRERYFLYRGAWTQGFVKII